MNTQNANMDRTRIAATNALAHHQIDVEIMLARLMLSSQSTTTIVDAEGDPWTFTARRRCRLFLMAKNPFMKKYEAIYATSK